MIEFKDEILEGEPQYSVRDANGNAIHDDVSIELSTPVRQAGTPLNKPFFENIQAYIQSVDRYNQTNLKIINEDSQYEKAFFPKTWETITSGEYRNGNIVIKYDPDWYNGTPDVMFDGNVSSGGVGNASTSSGHKHVIHMDYGEEIKLTELFVRLRTFDTGTVKFQASKDDATWVDIYSWVNVTEYTDYKIKPENPDWYRYYRFYATGTYTSYVINEWQTITAVTHKAQEIETPLLLDTYDTNKLINIIVPNNLDDTAETVYVNVNNIGKKRVLGRLGAGTKKTLLYNGEAFEVIGEEIDTSTKNVYLETNDGGDTQTKNLQFRIGNGKLIALSLTGTTSYSPLGMTPSAFIILDTERDKFLFAIGTKRVVKEAETNDASGTVQSDVTTQPISVGEVGTGRVDLANFWSNDSYGRVYELAIYVSNISLNDGVLTVPISLYTNRNIDGETASVSCFVNVIK